VTGCKLLHHNSALAGLKHYSITSSARPRRRSVNGRSLRAAPVIFASVTAGASGRGTRAR